MYEDFGHLILDFGPLLSFKLPDDGVMDGAMARTLTPVLPTLRAILDDPSILKKAMLDYHSLSQPTETSKDRETLEKGYAALATKYSDLIAALRAMEGLRSDQGQLTPINLLPVELLALIFTETMSPPRLAIISEDDIITQFDMNTRSVCRRWSHVIKSTPALWARLELKRTYSVHEVGQIRDVLRHSKSAPLELYLEIKAIDDHLFSILLPQIARAQFLCLDCEELPDHTDMTGYEVTAHHHHDHLMHLMRQLVKKPAPLLEVLRIHGLENIPNDIFSQVAPCRLQSVWIGWPIGPISPASCIFRCVELTHLELFLCEIWESVDDMLAFLDTLPKLQRLMWDAEAYETPIPFHAPHNFKHKSIRLPDLELLDLGLLVETIVLVIPVIHFPPSAQLNIQSSFLEEPRVDSPAFSSTMDALKAVFRPHFKSIETEELGVYGGVYIGPFQRHQGYQGFSVTMHSVSDNISDFTYGVLWDAGYLHKEYMEIMTQMLDWPEKREEIITLSAGSVKFIDQAQDWERLLIRLPQLAIASVSGQCAHALFCALRDNAAPSSRFGSALMKITVNRMETDLSALIIQTLDRRVAGNLSKLKLDFRGCEIEGMVLERLKLHDGVQRVRWDGDNELSSEEESEEDDEQ